MSLLKVASKTGLLNVVEYLEVEIILFLHVSILCRSFLLEFLKRQASSHQYVCCQQFNSSKPTSGPIIDHIIPYVHSYILVEVSNLWQIKF